MTSQRKVLLKYPEAEVVHLRGLGLTIYVVRRSPMHRRTALGEGLSASKAWVNAAKRLATGQEPYRFQ